MTCYEVLHNGKRLCLAGVPTGVLVGALTWVSRSKDADQPWSMDLRVGGLTEGNHVDWTRQDLQVGDEVVFRVVQADEADSPIDKRPKDASMAQASDLEQSRNYYRELKRRMTELEGKWGSELNR